MSSRPDPVARSSGLTGALVALFERFMPEPFVLSIGLTLLVAVAAVCFAPHGDSDTLLAGWQSGMFRILPFAFQMLLILVTGYAVADSRPVQRLLARLSAHVETPLQAVCLVFPAVAIAAWLNWGLGLVIAAFLSREVGRRAPVDFGWLVAGAYSAWSVCNNGLSSSIALSQASAGNPLNFAEKFLGVTIGLRQTLFAPFVWVPTVAVVVVMASIFVWIHPATGAVHLAGREHDAAPVQQPHGSAPRDGSPAAWLGGSPLGVVVVIAFGAGWITMQCVHHRFALDIDTTILLFLLAGLVLQGSPSAYADAVRRAAAQTGAMLLQYPFYGGIMGIMSATGLAAAIAGAFVAIASAASLPVWTYVASLVITFLVPSAGGHWAVQGPFAMQAAAVLHADSARTAMGVAMAENVSNMLQPFWAVPIVAMAGIEVQKVMGYTVITFCVSLVLYAAGLLLL